MKNISLKTGILISFFIIITIFAVSVSVLGYYLIRNDLSFARSVYNSEMNSIGRGVGASHSGSQLPAQDEKTFRDMRRGVYLVFLAIFIAAIFIAVIAAYVLAAVITRPLTQMITATRKISNYELGYRARIKTPFRELNELSSAFNDMSVQLEANDKKLASLNKSYLDLVSFVAHELKGIMSSTILNAYAVRDGFLGMINFKQRKAMDSVTRNLDYLAATVKKFLNLSRIEKNELVLNKTEFFLKADVFDVSAEVFAKPAAERGTRIINSIDPQLKVAADMDLLLVAANNLIGNAVKYGVNNGLVIVSARDSGDKVTVEIYNDARVISDSEKDKLFRKFSRLGSPETRHVQGTGLGLFISRQIIEKHGGDIWFEPREKGNAFIFQIKRGM